MAGFTKLDNGILDSSIWSEMPATRIVWITFLAKADMRGRVFSSRSGMIRASVVTPEEFDIAVEKFLSPDPDSRTSENDGKRLKKIEGGWLVLNYEKYRARDYSYDRENAACRMRKYRQKKKG